MLVPLETLSGWPAVPNPSPLQFLLLLFGVPLVLGLLIAAASYLGSTHELNKFGPVVNPNTAFVGAPGVEQASGEVPAGIEAKPRSDADTGGTSARW
jgi:hypothetical protein